MNGTRKKYDYDGSEQPSEPIAFPKTGFHTVSIVYLFMITLRFYMGSCRVATG